jgi:hypothetical protein
MLRFYASAQNQSLHLLLRKISIFDNNQLDQKRQRDTVEDLLIRALGQLLLGAERRAPPHS